MPSPDDGSFKQGKEGFGGVGRSARPIRVLALIFSARVIHGLMRFPLLQRLLVARMLVRIDDRVLTDAFSQRRAEIFLGHRSNHFHSGQALAFHQRDHG